MKKHQTVIAWLAALFVSAGPSALEGQTGASPAAGPGAAATSSAVSATSNQPAVPDNIVRLSAFEVRTTQGQGYSPGNSASALKSSQDLMDVPAQIILVTSDMIKDINSHTSSEVLAFAGVGTFAGGASISSRGSRVGNPYVDDVPQGNGLAVTDNTNIDTYAVIKGPVQIFYPLASLGGTVLATTKKPLPGLRQFIVDEEVQQWGQQRFTFDFNAPIGMLGQGALTYRVEGIVQSGKQAYYNSRHDYYGIFPNLEWDWGNTLVRFAYDVELLKADVGDLGLLTPTGALYTGYGRRVEALPPGDLDRSEQHDVRLSWTQRLSDNWQVKTQAVFWSASRYGSVGFPTTVNWNTNQITYTMRLDDGWAANTNIQSDVSGHYYLGHIPCLSAFGFNTQDQVGHSRYYIGTPVAIPITSAAINAVTFPPTYAIPQPANPGSRSQQYVSNGYFMESIDIVPSYLTLMGGFTFSKIETVTDTNLALVSPYPSTDANAHDLLHRMAAVVHVTKEIMAYASESTTFNPAVGVTYLNQPLPPVLGKSDEIGLKTAFLEGRISISVATYKMSLTNQGVLAAFPAVNIVGLNYYLPIGSTVSKGFDGSMALQLAPGWQIIAAGYSGTVHDQLGNPISATYENQWSVFNRYDFNADGPLKGLSLGGGVVRIGSRWFSRSGMILPGNAAAPVNSSGASLFKLNEGTQLNLFAAYALNRKWEFRVNCQNALDQAYVIGAQGVGIATGSVPRTFLFEAVFKF